MTDVTLTTYQRLALSALLGENERLAASGELSAEREETLRCLIAQNLAAFRVPSAYERACNDNHDETELDIIVMKALRESDQQWKDAGR
jgi:hypothetical protein